MDYFYQDKQFYPHQFPKWEDDETGQMYLERIGYSSMPSICWGGEPLSSFEISVHEHRKNVGRYYVEVCIGDTVQAIYVGNFPELLNLLRFLEPIRRMTLEDEKREEVYQKKLRKEKLMERRI